MKAIAFVDCASPNWIASTGFSVCRPKVGVNAKFLYHAIQSTPFIEAVVAGSTGVSYPAITPSTLGKLEVPLPSIEIQGAIGDFLERETARIDQLIEKKQRLVGLFQPKIEALVHEAIVAPSTEMIRFKHVSERAVRPVRENDAESFVRLGLYNRGRGIFKKPETLEEDMGDSTFFWVEAGDLILSGQFAWEGAVALASEEEDGCVVSHRYPVYRGSDRTKTSYLCAFLRTKWGDFILNDASRGAARRNRPLNVGILEKTKIPVPDRGIQERIDFVVGRERSIKERIAESNNRLRDFRLALITAAVTGQIDVATWGKRGTTDRRLDNIEAQMADAAPPEREKARV